MVDCIYESLDLENVSITRRKTAEMFGPATQVILSLMHVSVIVAALWTMEKIVTKILDGFCKPKEKGREKCRREYQNRCMDGKEEHAE